MGGVEKVAVALSQSPTADVFAKSTGMSDTDETKMITAMQGILDGNEGDLSPNESADFAFFVQKLHETGFF
uniref:Uncharacterized protein n=1 Tax=Plectus sambesii TaxID=2011161 RepID=A0A914X9C6_9BILA